MSLQLTAIKATTTIVYRFIGKLVYIRGSHNAHSIQLANQIKAKGGIVTQSNSAWLKCDMFGDNKLFNLTNHKIDLESNLIKNKTNKELTTASDENIEKVLCDFFKQMLEVSEFKCEVKEI